MPFCSASTSLPLRRTLCRALHLPQLYALSLGTFARYAGHIPRTPCSRVARGRAWFGNIKHDCAGWYSWIIASHSYCVMLVLQTRRGNNRPASRLPSHMAFWCSMIHPWLTGSLLAIASALMEMVLCRQCCPS